MPDPAPPPPGSRDIAIALIAALSAGVGVGGLPRVISAIGRFFRRRSATTDPAQLTPADAASILAACTRIEQAIARVEQGQALIGAAVQAVDRAHAERGARWVAELQGVIRGVVEQVLRDQRDAVKAVREETRSRTGETGPHGILTEDEAQHVVVSRRGRDSRGGG